MKPEEIRSLARATCCWVAYKHITGFADMLGEAMLAIPISEFFKTSTNWMLQSEVQYRKVCKSDVVPDFWCDFAGTPTYSGSFRFLLEAKYLKTKARNMARQITADIMRLSLPQEPALKRYFLLAGENHHFGDAEPDFLFGQNLFGLERGGGRYIKPREEASKQGFAKLFPHFEPLLRLEENYLTDYAYVQYGADETVQVGDGHSFRVMIWSVGRSKRSAEAGVSADD